MKKCLSLFLAAALVLSVLLCPGIARAKPEDLKGRVLADFTSDTADGKKFTLSESLKKHDLVLINFWATWCGPCLMEFPALEEAWEKYRGRVDVIALSIESADTFDILKKFASEHGLKFPIGRDSAGMFDGMGGTAIPTTLIVDRNRTVVAVEIGAKTSAKEFTALFDSLLKSQPPSGGNENETAKGTAAGGETAPAANEIGTIVAFGSYEQDGNPDNGKEAIEWIVLDSDPENHKALLLSRYILDSRPYYGDYRFVSWKDSFIRTWLNGDFLNEAFTSGEKDAIQITELNNDFSEQKENPNDYVSGGSVPAGEPTADRVFLLSYNEVWNKYIPDERERRARAAAGALDKGVWTASSGENRDYALWLLRTTESYADAVDLDGTRTYVRADMPGAGIRPALWIDTSLALLKEIDSSQQPDWRLKESGRGAGASSAGGVRVGDVIVFGEYLNRPIEWQVLEKKGTRVLLFGIDSVGRRPYNSVSSKFTTWENCTLRKWLNGEFLSGAFTRSQRNRICQTKVDNGIKQQRDMYQKIEGQPDTQDFVFLLSWQETARYFPTEKSRRMEGGWWTRSPGETAGSALAIADDGKMTYWCGASSNEENIHPVIWVDLK